MRGTVVRITKSEGVEIPGRTEDLNLLVHLGMNGEEGRDVEDLNMLTVGSRFPDTDYGSHTPEIRRLSETADNLIWARYASPITTTVNPDSKLEGSATASLSSSYYSLPSAPSRIMFKTLSTPTPLQAALQAASDAAHSASSSSGSPYLTEAAESMLVIVTGRSRRLAVENHHKELKQLMEEHGSVSSEVRQTMGDVASAFVAAGVGSGIIVVQAAEGRGAR
ncbi:hypothetical protein CPB84DRAFT_916109 [Gymnopilus junonius]|uniref:Uncharacterized protein n=1 Tax=Gymnopilus junonius TaxID=109634 RepID=A0A9P5P0A3_GYMJU|nr:hypothetical protein CPB84DRAFT_916109 [Gymnopilus junonius]